MNDSRPESSKQGGRLPPWAIAGLAAGLLLGACNDKNNEPAVLPPAGPDHVFMINFAFDPESLVVATGDTVTWVNQSSTYHTATSGRDGVPDSIWDSGFLAPGDSYRRAFPNAGTFHYFCTNHWGAGMQGAISVTSRPIRTHVRIQDYAFAPDSLGVLTGDTVVWVNDGVDIHTTTSGPAGSPNGLWDSGRLTHNGSFAHAFPDTGTYPYFCSYHYQVGMIAWVMVHLRP